MRVTRDGVPVLVHDLTLWRMGRVPLPTRLLSFDRLRRIERRDDGLQIPTFAEALSALPDRVVMAVEVKEFGAVMPAIAEIQRQGAEGRVLMWGRCVQAVRLFARELPDTERALLHDTWTARGNSRFLEDAAKCDADAISAHWNRITPGFVDEAHARGLKVYSKAKDIGSQSSRLAAGLDGLVSDWPEEAIAAVKDGRG